MTTWAFDLETEDWQYFVLGAAVSSAGDTVVFRTLTDLAYWYLELPSNDEVWAHNGGRFDVLLLIDALRSRADCGDIYATLAGSAISCLWVRGGAKVRDSARLAPMKLKKFAPAFGKLRKTSPGLPCRCGEDGCEGWCRIRRDMSAAERRKVTEYCIHDCRVLLSAIDGLHTYCETAGFSHRNEKGEPRSTLGGIAWATARETCDVGPELDWGTYTRDREAYYGGRTEVLRWKADRRYRGDIRSAYPAAMMGALPWGTSKSVRGKAANRAWGRGACGSYLARVYVPPSLPLLPMRVPPRLVWAVGYVEGWWYRDELDAAERLGARILRIERATLAQREIPWARPYVEKVWKERSAVLDGNPALALWLKLLGNSLSGKLAQLPEMVRLRITSDETGLPKRAHLIGGDVWGIPSRVLPRCARPLAAAAITAAPRALVTARLHQAGEDALYCDTDCVDSRRKLPVGKGDRLGDWTDEGLWTNVYYHAPKVYAGIDSEGVERAKGKGIPDIRAEDVYTLASGKTVTKRRGVKPIRSAAGGESYFSPRNVTRQSRADTAVVGTRLRLPDGGTVPLHRTEDGRLGWPGNTDPGLLARVLGRGVF